jgi:hypothetical protein
MISEEKNKKFAVGFSFSLGVGPKKAQKQK